VAITALTGLLGFAVARFYSEPLNGKLRRKLVPTKARPALQAATN